MRNNYRIEGDIVYIEIVRKDGAILETLIDLEDLELVNSYSSWYAQYSANRNRIYACHSNLSRGTRQNIKLHRVVMKVLESKLPIDHIYHNTLDNRKSQLRIVTDQENSFNTTKTKGYSWDRSCKKWQARIYVANRLIYLGHFRREEDARNAYLEAKAKYHIIGGIPND